MSANDAISVDETLDRNLNAILSTAIRHAPPHRALVIFDALSPLSRLLAAGYRRALPHAVLFDFDATNRAELLAFIDSLSRGDLVILVQSSRFDLREFRFRLELFSRGLAVVEHPHLGRMEGDEIAIYVDALAYDAAPLRRLGQELKSRLDPARVVEIVSGSDSLRYLGPFEDSKRNVGDYAGFANIGGQFPIGEVFTEPVELDAVSGIASVFAFGAADFSVRGVEPPFALEVERGRVLAAPGAPDEFSDILDSIRAEEGDVRLRELGFGLNRALTRERRLTDVGSYERMCGVHLSLGAKHAVYPKAEYKKKRTRFHVDVFVAAERVEIDGQTVYDGTEWVV